MIVEILIALMLGIFIGIISGITPGVHLNLISSIAVAFVPSFFPHVSLIAICVFVICMAITHTFVDSIPSTYLGAPNEARIAHAVAAHQLLMQGKGHLAVFFATIGACGGLLLSLMCVPIAYWSITLSYDFVSQITGYLVLASICFILFLEKKPLLCLFSFLLAGLFGVLVLQTAMQQPLLGLLSGMFGIAPIIMALKEKVNISPQQQTVTVPSFFAVLISSIVGTVMGFLAAFLPGLGTSQSSILASQIVPFSKHEQNILLTGGINTVNMLFSLVTVVAIQKARNGAIASLQSLVLFSYDLLFVLLLCCACAGFLSALVTLELSLVFAKIVERLPFVFMSCIVLLIVIGLVFFFDGVLGISVLMISTLIGLFSQYAQIPKHYLMGCLILPVLFFFLL